MDCRGYISSRPFFGERVPQRVQNIVIRDYCERNELKFLLSAVEVAIPNSYLMLKQLTEEPHLREGIVAYSLSQLPIDKKLRLEVLRKIIAAGRVIHFALETMSVQNVAEIEKVEQLFRIKETLPFCLKKHEGALTVNHHSRDKLKLG